MPSITALGSPVWKKGSLIIDSANYQFNYRSKMMSSSIITDDLISFDVENKTTQNNNNNNKNKKQTTPPPPPTPKKEATLVSVYVSKSTIS